MCEDEGSEDTDSSLEPSYLKHVRKDCKIYLRKVGMCVLGGGVTVCSEITACFAVVDTHGGVGVQCDHSDSVSAQHLRYALGGDTRE